MIYRGLELDRFQTDAIAALDENKSVLVAAPTGTGKSDDVDDGDASSTSGNDRA